MKRIVLDTNIAIALLNADSDVPLNLEKYEVFYLPIIVCGELLFGASNSKKSKQNFKKIMRFIKTCKVLNSNLLVAEEYASIRQQLKDNGTPIPENDIWIATISKVNNFPLATRDKHFEHIENLKLLKL